MVRKLFNKFKKNILPVKLTKFAAFLDFYFGISLKNQFGGPFNGQVKRRELFQEIINAAPLNAIVETGAFFGSTAEFISSQTNLPVYEIEINPYYYYYAYFRLKKMRKINFCLGDSRVILKNFQKKDNFPKKGVLFYLDAHWLDHLPLWEEVEIISQSWSESIVMIDDFEVPDDAGYGFDVYGVNNSLTLEYLNLNKISNFEIFFPSASSSSETGSRRGCVVLVTKDSMLNKIQPLESLRRIQDIGIEEKV